MHAKTRDPEIARVLLTKPYWIWAKMKTRCATPTVKDYKYYGARGITVCSEWLTFSNFWKDMGGSYVEGLTLDRINNNKGYSKENCRWVTMREQNRNRPGNVVFRGELAVDANMRLGGSSSMITSRIKNGWSMEDSFTKPVGFRHNKSKI